LARQDQSQSKEVVMKKFAFSAAAAAAFTAFVAYAPASAHPMGEGPSSGHYEWQSQSGPRASAPVRKWVSNQRAENEGVGGPYCDPANMGKPGHFEWRSSPQYGPRAPFRPSVRVWVEC
jgi:hypothetical protein